MLIRPAGAHDIEATAAVAAAAYQGAFAAILEPAVLAVYDAGFFAKRFAATLDRLRLAVNESAVLGFCVMTHAHIDMLFIAPAAQGSGAGSALLRDAERRGARSLECFAANMPARRFYERRGWRVTDAYRRALGGVQQRFVWYEVTTGQQGSAGQGP